jgi:hypothetical protein
MRKQELEIEDDVLVRRETILELFNPPPSRSSFFEWVKSGRIIKARGLKGYYLLNATRRKLRVPPVDVASFRKQEATPANRKLQLVYTALMLIVPEMTAVIRGIEIPEVLAPAEVVEIKRLAAAHRKPLMEQGELYFKIVYCRAVLDAEEISQQLDQCDGGLSRV